MASPPDLGSHGRDQNSDRLAGRRALARPALLPPGVWRNTPECPEAGQQQEGLGALPQTVRGEGGEAAAKARLGLVHCDQLPCSEQSSLPGVAGSGRLDLDHFSKHCLVELGRLTEPGSWSG